MLYQGRRPDIRTAQQARQIGPKCWAVRWVRYVIITRSGVFSGLAHPFGPLWNLRRVHAIGGGRFDSGAGLFTWCYPASSGGVEGPGALLWAPPFFLRGLWGFFRGLRA